MQKSSVIELVSGLLTPVLAAAGLAYALFGPVFREFSASVAQGGQPVEQQSRSHGLLEEGLEPATAAFLCAIFAASLVTALGAWMHTRSSRWPGRVLTVTSAGLLFLGAFVSMLSIGFLLLPAVVTACLAGSLAYRDRPRQPSPVI